MEATVCDCPHAMAYTAECEEWLDCGLPEPLRGFAVAVGRLAALLSFSQSSLAA